MPTILDRAIGVSPGHWLDDDTENESLYATRPQQTPAPAGTDASTAEAMPE
jgi:hypothetical protein